MLRPYTMRGRPRSSKSLTRGAALADGLLIRGTCVEGTRRPKEDFDNGEEYDKMHGRRDRSSTGTTSTVTHPEWDWIRP